MVKRGYVPDRMDIVWIDLNPTRGHEQANVRPVLVLSSNDGCVVARSQEIKDNNIPMGVPVFKIKDTLKDIGATR